MKNPHKSFLGGPDANEAENILRKKFKYTDSEIKKLKNESVLKETHVSAIPNLNLESDAFIIMLRLLKGHARFKALVSKYGIELYNGANQKNVIYSLQNEFTGKVIDSKITAATAKEINTKRLRIDIGKNDMDVQKKFAGVLALGVVTELLDSPNSFPKEIGGDQKLIQAGSEFSARRGREKSSTVMNASKLKK